MIIGEVFSWETTNVRGYESRKKMHVYIGEAGWRGEGGLAFLFINKSDYGGDLHILKQDFEFLDYDSYIGCGSIVAYSGEELEQVTITKLGRLKLEHARKLLEAIRDSEFMEGWQIDLCCKCLSATINNS